MRNKEFPDFKGETVISIYSEIRLKISVTVKAIKIGFYVASLLEKRNNFAFSFEPGT